MCGLRAIYQLSWNLSAHPHSVTSDELSSQLHHVFSSAKEDAMGRKDAL